MAESLLNDLIDRFCCLPGVGQKSAQRMAFHLLERDRKGGALLADALSQAMIGIGDCQQCRTFSESEVCALCIDPQRDKSQLCIVEMPTDVFALRQATEYKGLFFVLKGHLSPIDGIGPNELGLDRLELRFQTGVVKELILATNATIEGLATAHYVADMAERYQVEVMRIAQGVPIGGELEFIDRNTLSHAFSSRVKYKNSTD